MELISETGWSLSISHTVWRTVLPGLADRICANDQGAGIKKVACGTEDTFEVAAR
jgi:hypothetical protein